MASSDMVIEAQQMTIIRLMEESFTILKEMVRDKPGANGGFYAWLQCAIARAEESGNFPRAIAANIIMAAIGDELASLEVNSEHLVQKIQSEIRKAVIQR